MSDLKKFVTFCAKTFRIGPKVLTSRGVTQSLSNQRRVSIVAARQLFGGEVNRKDIAEAFHRQPSMLTKSEKICREDSGMTAGVDALVSIWRANMKKV